MITDPNVERYLHEHAPLPHPILADMEKLAQQRDFPIIGPLAGRLIANLLKFGHVHTVLECGSGYGYSAMWAALALPANGKVVCIEYDQDNIDLARGFFERAGLQNKVKFLQGNALDILPTLRDTYDFILNDANKEQYPELLPLMMERLRTGGMLVTDNILWKGKVAEENPDEVTRKIMDYNSKLIAVDNLWNSFIPLRDGLALSVKLRAKG